MHNHPRTLTAHLAANLAPLLLKPTPPDPRWRPDVKAYQSRILDLIGSSKPIKLLTPLEQAWSEKASVARFLRDLAEFEQQVTSSVRTGVALLPRHTATNPRRSLQDQFNPPAARPILSTRWHSLDIQGRLKAADEDKFDLLVIDDPQPIQPDSDPEAARRAMKSWTDIVLNLPKTACEKPNKPTSL